jgi:hypothetical protein
MANNASIAVKMRKGKMFFQTNNTGEPVPAGGGMSGEF